MAKGIIKYLNRYNEVVTKRFSGTPIELTNALIKRKYFSPSVTLKDGTTYVLDSTGRNAIVK